MLPVISYKMYRHHWIYRENKHFNLETKSPKVKITKQ